jgi:hypothetical protein
MNVILGVLSAAHFDGMSVRGVPGDVFLADEDVGSFEEFGLNDWLVLCRDAVGYPLEMICLIDTVRNELDGWLIHVDVAASSRFRDGIETSVLKKDAGEFGLLGMEEVAWLRGAVGMSLRKSFQRPRQSLIARYRNEIFTEGLNSQELYAALIGRIPVDKLWSSPDHNYGDPYMSWVKWLSPDSMVFEAFDSKQFWNSEVIQNTGENKGIDRALKLQVISGEIVARSFRSDESGYVLDMNQTQAAELKHQGVLEEVVSRMSSAGITCFQSDLLDCGWMVGDEMFLLEIKTIHEKNVNSQLCKGLWQLLRLRKISAFDSRFESSSSILLLAGEKDVWQQWQLKILAEASIIVLFWGSTVELLVGERGDLDDSLVALIS